MACIFIVHQTHISVWREKMILFNHGWQFAKREPVNFTPVDIPHDWLISDANNLYETGLNWYRRDLDAAFLKDGQRLSLCFDGVYMDSTLYVNGHLAGEWKYGYTAFEHDITSFLQRDGQDKLLMKVDYRSPNARWYTGAGIYRNVFLKIKNACHFVSDGIYITTGKRGGRWFFEVEAEVETENRPFELRHTLMDAGEGVINGEEIFPWDVENPRLYTVRSELLVNGTVMDSVDTRIGFRTTEFTTDRGFYLNGRQIKLKGVCLHHDLGALGAAVHPDAIRRQLGLLKAMGVNAVRTAHNPPAKVFMEMTDEMGFLVMSELLDMWESPKNEYDYARFFDEWIERDAASWIRRDRNHPSVILWSVGNEIADTHNNPTRGAGILRRLIDLVEKHDPKKNAFATLCSNYMPWENTQKCAEIVTLIGYNYGEQLYAKHHAAHPSWIIYGSETCSTAQSRAVYHFPLAKAILADDDLQCSALGNSATSWGAKNVEACIRTDFDAHFSLGQFVWAGQDYLGEPTPYHTKNSYLGHIDTAGFPKDSYYIFQAAWTDWKKAPMVHLFPYWDFSEGEMIDVRVCSNAPTVELFLNGESMGREIIEGRFVANWRFPYRKGTLRAVACDETGNTVVEECRTSFGDAVKLQTECEVFGELHFVTITAEDAAGNSVENANRRVQVTVEGGTLLALDNGDATDYEQYRSESRRLFGGKLLAIVKRQNDGTPRVEANFDENDIPVRKIELKAHGYTIEAHIFPENATYRDLYWRLTDDLGIDSPLGRLLVAADGKSATVVPKGDGEVCVRCAAKNGHNHISLISRRTLSITGYGKPFLDPYAFISGGLYTWSNAELTSGNERGVATLRDGESHVGFRDLDFGDFGSDEITLHLFPLAKEPFTFDIWEGMPLENGTHLCTATYDRGSIWNTYQESTFILSKRLRGVSSLCLVFRQKVHIKGFVFKKFPKAFQRLFAAEFTRISGDSFTIKADSVENIGNNVSIVFENMDFGSTGAGSVQVCWRSGLSKNPILFIAADGTGEIRNMIVVEQASSYTIASFPLEGKIDGSKTVTLSFLPGCKLDLAWFKFLE